jgi:hypothetical protein
VVWDQFNRVLIGIGAEAAAVEDLCRVAGFLSDWQEAGKVRTASRRYLESTAGDEPRRLSVGQTSQLADEHFGGLCLAVRTV